MGLRTRPWRVRIGSTRINCPIFQGEITLFHGEISEIHVFLAGKSFRRAWERRTRQCDKTIEVWGALQARSPGESSHGRKFQANLVVICPEYTVYIYIYIYNLYIYIYIDYFGW